MKTVLIGAGNVAYSLAPALAAVPEIELTHISSRSGQSAVSLAQTIPGCSAGDLSTLPADADLYILAVTDTAVTELAASLPPNPDALWLHTSGSVPASALARLSGHYGVLYPLQTFSRGRKLDMDQVPVFIEGSTPDDLITIDRIARSISQSVKEANSAARKRMHVAAVFACNFVTHMFDIADELLRQDGLDLSLLQPLIDETMCKVRQVGPHEAQTGPARRGDRSVMAAHAGMINPRLREIYRMLSDSIIRNYEQN